MITNMTFWEEKMSSSYIIITILTIVIAILAEYMTNKIFDKEIIIKIEKFKEVKYE